MPAERLLNRKVSTDFIRQPSDSLPLGSGSKKSHKKSLIKSLKVTVDVVVTRLNVKLLDTIPTLGTASHHGL